MTPQIQTRIDIQAPIATVWSVLTDLPRYQTWNPFIVSASGTAALGETLVCQPKMPGGRQYIFKPVVTRLVPGREFAWTGHVVHPLLGCGEHVFELEEIGENRVRLIHDEIFTGLFAPLVVLLAGNKTRKGFVLMNEALKREAEIRAGKQGLGA